MNISAPWIKTKWMRLRLWNAFYRHGIQWGFGLIQVGTWHLFYISSDGMLVMEDMERIQH